MGHEMMDMGYKNENNGAIAADHIDDKVRYPSICIDANIPDEIKSADIGHTCRMEVVARLIRKSEENAKITVCLELRKMGYISKEGGKDFKEYDKMSQDEREEYDRKDVGADEKEKEE